MRKYRLSIHTIHHVIQHNDPQRERKLIVIFKHIVNFKSLSLCWGHRQHVRMT